MIHPQKCTAHTLAGSVRDHGRKTTTYSLPTNLAVPPTRPFQWEIASHYFPEGYHAKSLRFKAPWYLLLRCFLIDLPEQLGNGLDTVSWRDHQVKDSYYCSASTQLRTYNRFISGSPLKWGLRVVFSERSEGQPGWLIGRWLVVGWLFCNNPEWARSVNIGNLATPSNTICIRGLENVPPSHNPNSKTRFFKRFYQLDRSAAEPEPLITLFARRSSYGYSSLPPEAPVPERLSRLCGLMNNEGRAFLYGPSSQEPAWETRHGNVGGHCICCARRRHRPGIGRKPHEGEI
ncbi:hypothetical protein CONLIGDRAFT_635831 [Coniochaeta ligniaria NRRL 30616]|uniref:Uncharacterized protein n=1 Tax=Coniochaeta ligniaria NRRL 30616 TaxID=1408157 RepID=A0A1J7JER4_9PEZI|nr:hypothetical protein CONLIGDRAFT_635831 [Coniochaeta ligniaria NRRL 30616]